MPEPWISPDLILSGDHVCLIPLNPSQVPDLFLAGRDPELWRWVPDRVSTPADMEKYVRDALEDRDRGVSFPFAIQGVAEGRLLGSTRYYSLSQWNRNVEIGYTWLEPSSWRTAVNTECKLLLLRHAFEVLGCLRVALRTDSRNQRSRRAMERFGAVQEGVLRKHMILPDGYVRDTVYYSITDEDWPRVRDFLTTALSRSTVP